MARPKKTPEPEIVKKAAAPKVENKSIDFFKDADCYKDRIIKHKDIDQYLESKGVTSYHEGHKIGLTIEQIKDLILNY